MHVDARTTGGLVRGRLEAELSVFRGIPYATAGRFAAPVSVEPWSDVLDATAFGPPPPQSSSFGMDATAQVDDAWLTTNVWTPDPAGRLPVMVWIQGGAYLFGTSGLPEYDGSILARGGVVLVTFNYRVGLEGFGWVDGTPPNRGLLDQVAALEWVRNNIGGFGGDPGRVTIFGQSAGGGSVAALLAMPRASGLFQRAIAQSVPGPFFTPALAADITRACAAELGMEPSDLPGEDPWLLPAAADEVMGHLGERVDRWGAAATASILLAPVVDGDVLPTTPWQADETADLLAPDADAYRAAYPSPQDLYEVVRSDWLFRMPSLHLARAQLASGGLAFLYELTWPAPGMGGIFGACHGLDVPLVFGNLGAGQPATLIGDPLHPDAISLSEQLRHAWIRFATAGDPGWPGFDTGATHLFDVEPTTRPYPETVSRGIWQDPPDVLDLLTP